MSTVVEIEAAIERLSPPEQRELREWLLHQPSATQPSALEKLRSLAGAGRNLPADLSANHDHYLHGTARHFAL